MSDAPLDIQALNQELITCSAQDRIRWAVDTLGSKAVTLASMQKTSSVILHMMHELNLDNEIFFVDTGFHFHETLAMRDEFMRRYKLNIHTLYPHLTVSQQEERYELKLYNYSDGQPDCCRLRKEDPFVEAMNQRSHQLVILGLRRDEGAQRKDLQPLAPDPRFSGYALHPLVDWDTSSVEGYLNTHGVPVHPLHNQGYPSIGCQVCTTAVLPGEDPRAGRWRHLNDSGEGPKYCGLNFSDGGGI